MSQTELNTSELSADFIDDLGAQAAQRLFAVCRHDGGGTRPIAELLVSLHNSRHARVDAYALCRRLDDDHFDDVLQALRWFRDAPFRVSGSAGPVPDSRARGA
ncbi:DUF7673 family protein [Paraburkholderia sp. WC7.3d]|uniref:DUF7673 family protein n=1 Tax=Paraburkholderia TaxID=1822464 RepID=UPI003D1B254C